jgi:hypothetical protein
VEITDIAIHPQGCFSIAAVRDLGPGEDRSELVVIRGNSNGPRIKVGPNADGIKISPDSNTLVVAVGKGLAIHVHDLSRGAPNIELTAVGAGRGAEGRNRASTRPLHAPSIQPPSRQRSAAPRCFPDFPLT